MKTVRSVKTSEIKRVRNEEADILVKNKDWKYCQKSLWKENVRDKK